MSVWGETKSSFGVGEKQMRKRMSQKQKYLHLSFIPGSRAPKKLKLKPVCQRPPSLRLSQRLVGLFVFCRNVGLMAAAFGGGYFTPPSASLTGAERPHLFLVFSPSPPVSLLPCRSTSVMRGLWGPFIR